MHNLITRINRFFLRNRDKGIKNLMLYIAIGSAIVMVMDVVLGNKGLLYSYLCFDKALILQGQVWRLFTYVFTEASGFGILLSLVFLYFFYHLGRYVEFSMGTLRFNIFYFSGVLIMDIFAMIFCPTADVITTQGIIPADYFRYLYGSMAWYLHLSILLIFAATNPDSRFTVLFFIPVKAWFMGLVYLGMIGMEIFQYAPLFPHNLFPLVALLNFALFAGKDILNLFPFLQRIPRKAPQKPKRTGTIPLKRETSTPYSHRCTVCGRTDISDPGLEFRYCSRCNGYFCYCEDHINNHNHVE